MERLLPLLEDRVCLVWFVAPFAWPTRLISWCLWSCFECVTTSVTSSGYCEAFVKTALIKSLLNRETETLLPIISGFPVEDISWDFLSSISPLESEGAFAVDLSRLWISPLRTILTLKSGRRILLSMPVVHVGCCLCQTTEETVRTWVWVICCSTTCCRPLLHGEKWCKHSTKWE